MPNQSILPLDAPEQQRIDEQLAHLTRVLEERHSPVQLTGEVGDVERLQTVLDRKIFSGSDTYELQALGLAFGKVLASEAGLHWVVVEDEYGRDPALRYRETSLLLFPLTMISKRVEREQPLDAAAMFRFVLEQVRAIGAELEAEAKPP